MAWVIERNIRLGRSMPNTRKHLVAVYSQCLSNSITRLRVGTPAPIAPVTDYALTCAYGSRQISRAPVSPFQLLVQPDGKVVA